MCAWVVVQRCHRPSGGQEAYEVVDLSAEIARELTRRCLGRVRHCQTVGPGRRGMRAIERYPPKFVDAVLRGLRREAIARGQL
eukprot:46646-Pyramimonas_sp.AAC.1